MKENSREISIIKERILQYLDFKGISKYKFYQETGVTNGVLSQKNGISEENILRFLNYYTDISSEWLLTGKGEMLKGQTSEPAKGKNLIPLYEDVSTIGGHNSISAAVDGHMPANELIDAGDWFNDATAAIRHYGDSMMEYPSGCILALKLVQDKSQIILGANYCIETDEFRVTKRLQTCNDDSVFMAYSSNTETYPDGTPIHQPFAIPKASIRRLYLVLGYVVKQFSSGAVFIKK